MFNTYKTTNIQQNNNVNRIMILEDTDGLLEYLVRSIELDYSDRKIDIARNEKEAIELLDQAIEKNNNDKTELYDFVIADVNLTKKGGSEFGGIHVLEYINANKYKEVKVIIITAHSRMICTNSFGKKKNVLEMATDLGAYACLSRNTQENYLDSINTIISEPHQNIVRAAQEIEKNLMQLEQKIPSCSYDDQITYIDNNISTEFKHRIIKIIGEFEKNRIEDCFYLIEEFIINSKHIDIIKAVIINWIESQRTLTSKTKTYSNAHKAKHETQINFSPECTLNHYVELQIQLIIIDRETNLRPQNKKDAEKNQLLDIHITAKSFELKQKCQKLEIPFNNDSQKKVFQLKPCELGEQTIEIEFFYKGSRVGYAIAKTQVKA